MALTRIPHITSAVTCGTPARNTAAANRILKILDDVDQYLLKGDVPRVYTCIRTHHEVVAA
jgi:hypothetical protein